jgi:hypothetical protein
MKQKIKFFVIYCLPIILWAALIFKLSSGSIPVTGNTYWQNFAIKKSAHVLFFGFLSLLIYRALVASNISKMRALIWAVILTTFYGATDEFHQSFSQVREAKVRDVGFDGLGAFAFTYLIYKFLPKMPKKVVELATKFQLI